MTTRQINHQRVRAVVVDLGIENIGAGNGITVKLPMGAIVLRLLPKTITAFDSATTATHTVSDGTTTLVNAVDVKSAGNETVANVPIHYPNGAELTFSLAETGAAATVGRVLDVLEYVLSSGGDEVYG